MTKNFLRGYHPWFHFFPYDSKDSDVFMSKFGGASFAANIDGLSFWSYAGYDWNYGVTINCWPGSDTGASILANNQYTGPGQRKYIDSGLPERFSFADQYYNRGIRFNGRSTTDGENTFPEASLAFSVIDTLGDVYIHAPEEWWGLYATNQSSKIPYTTAYKNPDTWPELQGKKWKKFLMVGGGWVGLTTNGELWSVINRISNSDTRIDIRDSQPEVWKSGLSWNYRHSRNISSTNNEFENSSGFKVVNKLGNYGLANYSFKVLHSSPTNNIVYTNQINTYQPQRIYNYYDEKLVIQGTANEVYDQINALLISKGVNLPANPSRRLSGKNYENLLPLIAQKLGYDRASVVQTNLNATTGYVTTSTDGENFTVVDSGTFVNPTTSNPAILLQLIAEANRDITGVVFEGKSVPYKDIYVNTDVRGNCSVYAIAEDNTVYVWGHTGGDGSSPIESDHRIGKKQNGDKFNARSLDGPVASNLGGGKGLRDIGMTADGGVCWGIDGDDHLVIWSIATEGNPVVYSQHQIEKIIHWDTNLGGPTGASTRSDLNGFIILTKDTHEIVVMNNVFNTLSKWPSSRGVYIENDSNATAYTTSHNTDYNRWEVGTVRKSDFDSDRSPGLIQYIQGGPVDQWVDIAYSSSTFGTNYQRASFDVVDNQGRVFKIYNIRFEEGNLRYFYRQLYNDLSNTANFAPSRDFRFDGAYGRQFLKAFSQNAGPNNEYDLAVAPAIIRAAQNTPFPTPEASKPATEPPPPPPPEPTTEPLLTYLLGAPSAKACFSLSNEGYSIPLDVIKPINSELKVGDRVRSSESEYLNHENLIKLLDPAKSFDDPLYLRSSKIKTLTYPSLPNDDFVQYSTEAILNNRPSFLTKFTDANGIDRDFKRGHARSIHKFQDSKLGVKIKDLHATSGSAALIQIKSRWGVIDTEFSNSHYYTQLTHYGNKANIIIHKIIWNPDTKESINTKLFGISVDPDVNGKTLYLETIGNKITVYIDETEIGSVTDDDIAGSGVSSVILLEYDSNLDNVAEIDGIELIADRKSPTVYKLEKDLEGGFPYSKIVSVNACDDFVEALSVDDISLDAEIPQPVPDEGIVPDGGISGGRFNINYTDNRHIYTFNRSGKLFVGTDSETNTFDILSIGGGGGGGANRGGGGGAGGLVKKTITLDSGYYDVHVGQGGRPGANGRHTKLIKENVLLDHDFSNGETNKLKLRNGSYSIEDGKLTNTASNVMIATMDNDLFNGYVEADITVANGGISLISRSQTTTQDSQAYVAHISRSGSNIRYSIWTGVHPGRETTWTLLHYVDEANSLFSGKVKFVTHNNRLLLYVNNVLKIDIDNDALTPTNYTQFSKYNSINRSGKFGIRTNGSPGQQSFSNLKIVKTTEILTAYGGGAGGGHNSYGYPLHGQDGGSGGGGSLNYWAGSEELSNVDPRPGTALIDCNQDNHKQLLPGQKLLSGQKLYTNNGTYELVMLPDGNLMERKGRQVVWQTNTSGNAGAFATVTYDGRLVVVLGENVLFETSTSNTAGSKLILKESGELVLFNPDGLQNFDSENLLSGGLHAMWYGGGMAQGGGAKYERPSNEKMRTGKFWHPYSNPYTTTNISYPSNWPTGKGIDDNYGYTAWGYFKPPVDGFYQFRTQSDDGSAVWLGPQAAWCNFTDDVNNGLILDNKRTGYQSAKVKDSNVIYLEKNRAYPIRIIHREGTGDDRMLFQWKGSSYDETMTTGEHINSSSGSLGWNNDLSQYFYRSAVPENFGIDCFTYETWSNGVDDGSLLGAVDKQGNDGEASGYSDNNPRSTGGGGGAGGSGVGGSIDNNPDGGIGLAFDFMGEETYYAGGGGGAKEPDSNYSSSDNGRGGFGGGGNGGSANVGVDGLGGGGGGGTFGADGGRGGDGLFRLSFVSNNIIPIPNTVVEGGDRTEYVKDGKTFAVHTFTESSTLDIQSVNPNNTFDMLVVAGGGGGGKIGKKGGGGGGGGGVIYLENNILEAGSYSIVVGSGGARDRKGGNSSITNTHSDFSLVAVGGGRGAQGEGESTQTGGSGGSGGGGGFKHSNSGGRGTAGQGFSGGRASNGHYVAGGGGGGAGGNGGAAVRNPNGGYQSGGPGGPGREIAIDGVNKYYAGGGAGHGQNGQNVGGKGGGGNTSVAGRSGTGGGGGAGASGGSGIVIISYEVLAEIPQITPSPTATITSTATATPAETPDSTPAETPPSTPRETPSQTQTPSDPVRGYWYYISDELKDICYTNKSKRILVYNFTYRGIQLSPGDLLVKRDFTDNPVDEDYWSWSELTELVKAPNASYLYISYVDLSVFDEERISYVVKRTSNGFAAIAQAASVCPTPTSTPTVSFSSTPDATATPTSSITHTPTRTASRTPSNTPEESPKATPTTTPPNTPSHTQTATNTATPTVTATNTSTPTVTATQTSTHTQTPTASITPSDGARRYQYYISDDHLELCQAPNISSDPPADGLISQLNKTAYSAELTGWENRAQGAIGKLLSVYDADNGIYESSDSSLPADSSLQSHWFLEEQPIKDNSINIDVYEIDVDTPDGVKRKSVDLYAIHNSSISFHVMARVINYGGGNHQIHLYKYESGKWTALQSIYGSQFNLPSLSSPVNFRFEMYNLHCKVYWDNRKVIDYVLEDTNLDTSTNIQNIVHIYHHQDPTRILTGKPRLKTIVSKETKLTVDTDTKLLTINDTYTPGGIFSWGLVSYLSTYRPVAAVEISRFDWEFEDNIYDNKNTSDDGVDDELFQPVDTAKLMILKNEFGSRPFVGIWLCNDNWQRVSNLTNLYKGNVNYTRLQDYIANTKLSNSNVELHVGRSYTNNNTFERITGETAETNDKYWTHGVNIYDRFDTSRGSQETYEDRRAWVRWLQNNENDTYSLDISNSLSGLGDEARAYKVVKNSIFYNNTNPNNTISIDLYNMDVTDHIHGVADEYGLKRHYKYISLYNRLTWWPTDNRTPTGAVVYRYYHIFARFINYGNTNTSLPPRLLIYTYDSFRNVRRERILADSYYAGGNYRYTARPDMPLPTQDDPVKFSFTIIGNYLSAYWNDNLILDYTMTDADINHEDPAFNEAVFDDSRFFMRRQQASVESVNNKEPLLISKPTVYTHNNLQLNNDDINFNSLPKFWAFNEKEQGSRYDLNELVVKSDWTPPSPPTSFFDFTELQERANSNADTLYIRKTIENYDEVALVAEIKANTQSVLGPVGKAIISDIPELCPTPTPTPTHSQTPTYSPTSTPPGTPTPTQTPTKTATATQTPTKTTTPTYTPSETNYPDREIFFWGQNLSDYDYDTIDSVQQGMPIVFGDVSVTRNLDGYLINGTQITSFPPLRAPDNIFVASSITPQDETWQQSGLLDLVRSDLSAGSVNVIFSVYKHTFESDNDTKEYENGIRMIVLQTGWSLETNRRNNTYQLIDINYRDHQQIWNALEEYFGVTLSRLWTDDPKDIILTKYDFAPVENDAVDAPFETETKTIARDIIQPLTNIIAGSYGQLAPNNTLELTTDRTESTYIQSHYSIDNQKVNSELSVDISDLSIDPDQRFPGQTNQFAFIDLYLVQNDNYSIVARMINYGGGNHSVRLVTRPIRSFNDKTLQTFTGFDLPSVDNPINLRVKITDYNICQIYFNNALVIQYTLTDDDRYRFDNLYTSNNTSMVNIMVAGAAGRIALQGRPELKVTDSVVQSNVILNENVQQIDSEFKNIVWKKVLPIFLSPKIGVTFGIANNQIYAWGGTDTDTTDRDNTNLYPAIIKNSEELNNQEVLDIDYGYSDLNDYFLYILTKDDTGNRALYTLDISVGNQDLEISEIIISNISSNVLSKVDLDQFNLSRDEITTYINVNNLQEDFPETYPGIVGRPLRTAQLNIPKILKPTVDLDILGMSAIRSDGRRYYMSDRARSDTPIPDFHVIDYDRSSYQEIFVLVNGAYVDRFGEEILTDLDRLKECDLLYYYKDTSKFINTISGAYELKTFDEILDSSVNAYYSKPVSKTIVAVRGMGFTNTDGEYVPPVPFYTHRDNGSRIDHIGYAFSKPSPYVSKGLFEPAVGFIPLGPDSADMMSNIDSFEIYRSPDLDFEPDQIHKRNLAEWDDRKKNKDKEIFDKFVIKAACGNNFFFMIDNTGDAYSWGDNRNGQLGIGANVDVERRCLFQNCDNEPRLIENYKFKDINIFRGNWNDHIAYALTLDGQPLYWGSNIGDSPQLMAEDSGYDDYEFAGRSFHPSPTPTPSFTPTPSVSISLTPTNSVTPTNTPTYTSTNTQTPSFTPTHSVTPTFTPTHTSTISNTPSVTATHTPTRTVTPTFTEITAGNYYYLDDNQDDLRYERRDYGAIVGIESTNFAEGDTLYRDIESNTKWLYNDLLTFLGIYITPQPTQTMTPTKTNTPTPSVTSSVTPSNSATPTVTPTNTATSTVTPSYTASVTQTETPASTATPTASVTASYTSTPTNTITHTNTASYTPSNTPTITNTITNTKTQTPTISPTATDTTGSFSFDIIAQNEFANVFALPLVSNGEYDFIVNYGDGRSQRITNANFDQTNYVYLTPGTYRVSIRGIIKGWSIQNTPNVIAQIAKESYGNVYSWGDLEFIDDVSGMFAGCSNLNILASDAPKIGNTLEDAFANCDLTNSANVANWDISRVANMRSAFLNTNIDINLANWNISSLTNATNFMAGCTLSTTNYDNILKSWQLLAQDNVAVNIHFGNSRYTANSQASFGRDTLTSAPYNWTITDGGTA